MATGGQRSLTIALETARDLRTPNGSRRVSRPPPDAIPAWRPLELTQLESLWESAFGAARNALQAAAGCSAIDHRELGERRRALEHEQTEIARLLSWLGAARVAPAVSASRIRPAVALRTAD